MTVDNDGKRLTCLHQRGLEVDRESLLTQKCNSHMSCRTGACVDGRYHRMTGQRCFHRRVTFHVSHLADTNDVGVETKGCYHKVFLCDVIGGIVRGTGERMHRIIDDVSILTSADERQLSGTRFNGEYTLVIGNGGHDGIQQGGLTA